MWPPGGHFISPPIHVEVGIVLHFNLHGQQFSYSSYSRQTNKLAMLRRGASQLHFAKMHFEKIHFRKLKSESL